MSKTTIKQLLEAGVHFGHQTHRWNPKMKKYIFGARNGIHIINLEITLKLLEKSLEFVEGTAREGKDVLFIGTKKQAQDSIRESASRSEMPYVNQRWLGGMLTNFQTVRKSLSRIDQIENMEKDGSFQFLKKKEVSSINKERVKLEKNFGGVRKMKKLPGAVFVIDSKKEENAIKEAIKLGIPVIGILDSNCDPDLVNYPIPGNDDAIRAIKLFCDLVADSVTKGRNDFKQRVAEQQAAEDEAAGEESSDDTVAVAAMSLSDDDADDTDEDTTDIEEVKKR